MTTLVFDIETVGESWESLDETTQTVLLRSIPTAVKDDSQKEVILSNLKEGLALSPLTGAIVAIGLYDVERRHGAVYYTGVGTEADEARGEFILKQRSEKEMLKDFWEGAKSYDTFVSFNGRNFDVPFLLHRSVVHHIIPTCSLMEGRYLYQQKNVCHVDVQDQLTFYGAMFRKPSLHLFCRAYGIESPQSVGVGGDAIAELFVHKKFRDIALHNLSNVTATTQLYAKWLEYLAPSTFRDEIL
jgi:DNA polymerase elongation subunit (family B)